MSLGFSLAPGPQGRISRLIAVGAAAATFFSTPEVNLAASLLNAVVAYIMALVLIEPVILLFARERLMRRFAPATKVWDDAITGAIYEVHPGISDPGMPVHVEISGWLWARRMDLRAPGADPHLIPASDLLRPLSRDLLARHPIWGVLLLALYIERMQVLIALPPRSAHQRLRLIRIAREMRGASSTPTQHGRDVHA